MNLEGYAGFRRTVTQLTGIDLDCYKGSQLERRLQGLLRRLGVADLRTYGRLITDDPGRLEEFRDFLTINVTEFFRNPERWEELRERILPELLSQRRRLRIWSAGCSTGAEPYSVAILLHEMDPGGSHLIVASDLDPEALASARRAVYHERELREVSPRRRARYFTGQESGWALHPEIRGRVRLVQHNLLQDPCPDDLDLVLCRNVVIYFTEAAKDQLYRRIHSALRPGGILFVGGTESLLRGREIGFAGISPVFYRAVEPVVPLTSPAEGPRLGAAVNSLASAAEPGLEVPYSGARER